MSVNLKLINTVNNYLLKGIKVDFTFLNLVNSTNMKKRLIKRKSLNRYDKFKSLFYKKVQEGFIKIANQNPKKYLKINSNLDIFMNKKIILDKIDRLT